MSACVCPAASEERAWAPLPASSRAESQPPSRSAGTRGKRTGAPTRRSGLIASSSPPQESGSALRLGSRPGVGPPSGYCTADRGASAASPARRDPLVKASGQTTVAVRTPPPPRMGAERGPSPLQSWPTVLNGLPVCFLIPLHPRRQVRLLQKTNAALEKSTSRARPVGFPLEEEAPRSQPQPRPCILNWLLGRWSQRLSPHIDSFLTVCPGLAFLLQAVLAERRGQTAPLWTPGLLGVCLGCSWVRRWGPSF